MAHETVRLLFFLLSVFSAQTGQQGRQVSRWSLNGPLDRSPGQDGSSANGLEAITIPGQLQARRDLSLSGGQRLPKPSIDWALTPTNVTKQLGATVYLHCYVRNIGQKTVTWLRQADYHVLTVGLISYTTDERFSAVRGEPAFVTELPMDRQVRSDQDLNSSKKVESSTEDWMLQIRGLQKADAGFYECQVNTQHPMLSVQVLLNVLSPRASITEGNELSVMSGSELSITCVIHDCPQIPLHVFWYHNDRVVNYDGRYSKQNISTAVPSTWAESLDAGRPLSRLTIQNASRAHSGSYVCAPIDSSPATIHVHVFHAEEQMSRRSASKASSVSPPNPLRTLYSLGPLLALQMAFLILVALRGT